MRSKKFGFLLSAAVIFAMVFGLALKVTAGQMSEAIQSATISTETRLSASQSVDPCVGATSKWALWTGGVCLRGFNVTFDNKLPDTYTQADFDAIAATGANVVRLIGSGLYSETAPYALDTVKQTNLDNALAMAQKANLFAFISVTDGPGRIFDNSVAILHSVWTTQVEQDKWVEMWKYTSARYKDNPIVVGYDLMNEPNSDTILPTPVNLPTDFYPAYANTLYDWNPLAKRISDGIRQVDTVTPILIGGLGWSAAPWLGSVTSNGDGKTVYTFHQYGPGDGIYTQQAAPYTNSYGTTTGTYTRTDLTTLYANASSFKSSRNVPVANSEFGVQRYEPGADQWLNDNMDIMESIGMNYIIHEWEIAGFAQTHPYYLNPIYNGFDYQFGTDPANHVAIATKDNVLMTVIQKYLLNNTVRPSNIGAVTQTGANNCAATVSSSLVVHIPVVTYSGANYWADLQYNSANSTLTVSNAGAVSDMSPYSNCMLSTLSSAYKLHIPVIILNGLSYWADLQYSNSVFVITGGGQN